jgi:hypothetical protein
MVRDLGKYGTKMPCFPVIVHRQRRSDYLNLFLSPTTTCNSDCKRSARGAIREWGEFEQCADGLSGKPARRSASHSSASAVAVEAFVTEAD